MDHPSSNFPRTVRTRQPIHAAQNPQLNFRGQIAWNVVPLLWRKNLLDPPEIRCEGFRLPFWRLETMWLSSRYSALETLGCLTAPSCTSWGFQTMTGIDQVGLGVSAILDFLEVLPPP